MFTHRTLDFANKMRIKINKIDCSSWYTGNHYNLYSNATQTRFHFSSKDSTGSAFCAPPTSHSFVGAEGCSMCAHSNACQQAAAATTTTAMESETSGSGEQNCDNSLFHSTSIAATTNFCAFIQNSALLWTDSGNDVWKYMRHERVNGKKERRTEESAKNEKCATKKLLFYAVESAGTVRHYYSKFFFVFHSCHKSCDSRCRVWTLYYARVCVSRMKMENDWLFSMFCGRQCPLFCVAFRSINQIDELFSFQFNRNQWMSSNKIVIDRFI